MHLNRQFEINFLHTFHSFKFGLTDLFFVAFLIFIAIISSEAVLIKFTQCICCFTSVLALIDFKKIINGRMVCLNLTLDTQSVCYCIEFPTSWF